MYISVGWCGADMTPSLTHWSYVFLALTHRFMHVYNMYISLRYFGWFRSQHIWAVRNHVCFGGLVRGRYDSVANALELCFPCAVPSFYACITCITVHVILGDFGPSTSGLFETMCISMGWCGGDMTPSLTHWSYVFLAPTHRFMHV